MPLNRQLLGGPRDLLSDEVSVTKLTYPRFSVYTHLCYREPLFHAYVRQTVRVTVTSALLVVGFTVSPLLS
jgi:hypothetical protein